MKILISFIQRQIEYREIEWEELFIRRELDVWAKGTLFYEGLLFKIAGIELIMEIWRAFLPKKYREIS